MIRSSGEGKRLSQSTGGNVRCMWHAGGLWQGISMIVKCKNGSANDVMLICKGKEKSQRIIAHLGPAGIWKRMVDSEVKAGCNYGSQTKCENGNSLRAIVLEVSPSSL